MDLNTLWFALIAVLFIGFFFLEGFDYGVGILMPFLGRTDRERRTLINTIGPFWDGNEVWLLTAGGAMFAAFPHWYATMFSGFYLPLVLVLLALILRGVAFEFRSKDERPGWRKFWDWALFGGSLLPGLLLGVALSNIVKGVPIDGQMHYVGGFFNLLSPYSLLAGVAAVAAFALHGALFLTLRTTGELKERAHSLSVRLGPVVVVLTLILVAATYLSTDLFARLGVNPGISAVGAGAALLSAGWFVRQRQHGWAFAMTGTTIALTVVTTFHGLYPRVMISSLGADLSLTIYNASSSPYTLTVMSVVALIFVPVVLFYQAWSYRTFRARITDDEALHY
jgi:cytochrome bd ubiquinol oxidase subunit II